MATRRRWFLIAGATAGAAVAWVVVLCERPSASGILLVVGAAGGAAVAAAAGRLVGSPLAPAAETVKAAPEVEKVYRAGYEIWFWRERPSKRFARYGFVARRRGRQLGRLDADFIGRERRLYMRNVYVAEAHLGNGLAAALLVCAAKTTDCSVVTTSGRTADGAAFCVRMRSILKRHGVELRDGLA